MNDASSTATSSERVARPMQEIGLARVGRLARKELRETLRDRRTIITLVVMPLLVYPILSFAFNQFLLSSFDQQQKTQYHIAVPSQNEVRAFELLLKQGHEYLQDRESPTAGEPLSGGPVLGADLGGTELPPSEHDIFPLREGLTKSLEDLVRDNEIDLGVRVMPREATEDTSAVHRFQIVYRSNTPISRQAASYVERRMRAANERDQLERLRKVGDREPQRVMWRLRPVADEEGHSFWLGTIVPLVLILMTITGAVYPAIDLTAGERERNTLESLMAAPVPRLAVLMAKYVAVVTVAMLTAVVNLTAMTATVSFSPGLGPLLFGEHGLAPQSMLAVLMLLVLFAAFFSAVLLLITSFARSFKEAQAYLIPLMVVSLAPGFMSVMPGLELGPVLSIVPLANIVLLSRDVLEAKAHWIWGGVAVLSTILYGGLALALAARVFGSDAILYGSEGSWGDLFRRPRQPRFQATIAGALTTLAVIAPLYIVLSGLHAQLHTIPMVAQLLAAAGISLILFILVPVVLGRWQGLVLRESFQLRAAHPLVFVAAVVLGLTLWPLAYDCIILCMKLGISTISWEKLAENRSTLFAFLERLRAVPPVIVVLALAVCPAIGEELFFRGYLLGALRGRLPAFGAILLTAVVFGLFHATVGGIVAIERIISSTFLGFVLGFICWRSRSVVPGIVVHMLHNSLMVSLNYFSKYLQAWGVDLAEERFLPGWLVAGAALGAAGALGMLRFFASARSDGIAEASPDVSIRPEGAEIP